MARRRRRSTEERLAEYAAARILHPRHGGKRFLILLIVALIAWAAWRFWDTTLRHRLPDASVTGTTRDIRIATWNLRKFSERARPDIVTIARIVQSSAFDLIAIQEVQQEGQSVQRLRRQLGEPWRHLISDSAGNGERYAFLYRSDIIESLGEPALVDRGAFARRPCMASFRAGQFDFTLLTVHLWYGEAGASSRREQEVQSLAYLASSLISSSPEKDILILGDFNEFHRTNYLRFLENAGWRRLISDPTNLSSTEIYDNLLINPAYTREFAGRTAVVHFDETLFANDDRAASDDVSDHRPACADFATNLADDD